MALSTALNGIIPRVPAWKRLGLQLKYAQEDHVEAGLSSSSKKRKRGGEENDKVKSPSRKARRLSSPSIAPHPTSSPSTAAGTAKSKPVEVIRKSVSFTPDTKAKDGESIKTLFKAWVEEEKAKDPSFRPEQVGEALTIKSSPVDAVSGTPQSRSTKPRKKKRKKAKHGNSNGTQISSAKAGVPDSDRHPALNYLLQYHQSRDDWKFSKAKQSYLLKHILDLDRIPLDYDKALCLYITGLQGEAVRARVKNSAESVRSEQLFVEQKDKMDDLSSSSPDLKRKREEYEQALSAFVNGLQERGPDVLDDESHPDLYPSSEELALKLKRRKRAEAILWALSPRDENNCAHHRHVHVDAVPAGFHHQNGVTNGVLDGGNPKHRGQDPEGDVAKRSAAYQRITLRVKPVEERPVRLKIRMRKLRTNAAHMEEYNSSSSSSSDSGSERDGNKGDAPEDSAAGSGEDYEDASTSSDSGSDSGSEVELAPNEEQEDDATSASSSSSSDESGDESGNETE